MISSHADLRECYLGLVSLKSSLLLGGPWSNESKNGLFPSSCRDFAKHHVIPVRLCATCSNSCALVAILSVAYCEYWRVFFRPRKSEMWLASLFILTRLTILTITYADRSRPTLHEPFRNGLVCDLDINCTLRCIYVYLFYWIDQTYI